MIGVSDIESWDDDVRSGAIADLRRAGWDRAARGDAPTPRSRRLLARFRVGEPLTTRELADLRSVLVGA